jgi:aspartate/methionine/tyrosine aminotransferase
MFFNGLCFFGVIPMEFKALSKTPIFQALSPLGKAIFQSPGIFYWATKAKKDANINATIGSAMGPESDLIDGAGSKNVNYYLPKVKEFISLHPETLVAYAPVNGVVELRDLWEKWVIFKGKMKGSLPSGSIDLANKISKPVICTGITDGIFILSRLFVGPKEWIISPNKRWENYDAIFVNQNDSLVESFEFFKNGIYNVQGMLDSMNKVAEKQDKIVIILNFPNNPTGYSPSPQEITAIIKALNDFCEQKKKPVVVLCDDAYEGYVYTPERPNQSIFYELVNQNPLLIPIKMDGSSKEMLMYGARIGAITLGIHSKWLPESEVADLKKEWDNKMEAMIRSTISNSNHLCQEILIKIMAEGFEKMLESRQKVFDILAKRFNASIAALKKYNTPKITMDPPGGGFFLFLNVDGIPADKLAEILVAKYKLGVIPAVIPKENINGIRVAYCSVPEEKIDECFQRIDAAVRELSV